MVVFLGRGTDLVALDLDGLPLPLHLILQALHLGFESLHLSSKRAHLYVSLQDCPSCCVPLGPRDVLVKVSE